MIEDGAYFKGSIDITKAAPPRPVTPRRWFTKPPLPLRPPPVSPFRSQQHEMKFWGFLSNGGSPFTLLDGEFLVEGSFSQYFRRNHGDPRRGFLAPAGSRASTSETSQDRRIVLAISRRSNGAEQFFAALQGSEGLSILDLAVQARRISRLSLTLAIVSLPMTFGIDGPVFRGRRFFENQGAASRAQRFLDQSLNFPDGLLRWRTGLGYPAISRPRSFRSNYRAILRIRKPGGLILAFSVRRRKPPRFRFTTTAFRITGLATCTPRYFRQIQYLTTGHSNDSSPCAVGEVFLHARPPARNHRAPLGPY